MSIVCITYNHECYIEQALNSFLSQKTNFSYEIVVGDDNSMDSTAAIIQRYSQENHDLIKPHFQSENIGMMENFLHTMSRARGKYIAICDGDDYWIDQEKLQTQIDILEGNSAIGLIHTGVKLLTERSNRSATLKNKKPLELSADFPCEYHQQLLINTISSCTAVFRKDLFDQFVDKQTMLEMSAGDYFIWLELATRTQFAFLEKKMGVYRIQRSSVTKPGSALAKKQYLLGAKKIRDFYINKKSIPKALDRLLKINHNRVMLRVAISSQDKAEMIQYSTELINLDALTTHKKILVFLSVNSIFSPFTKALILILKTIKRTF